MQIEIAAA